MWPLSSGAAAAAAAEGPHRHQQNRAAILRRVVCIAKKAAPTPHRRSPRLQACAGCAPFHLSGSTVAQLDSCLPTVLHAAAPKRCCATTDGAALLLAARSCSSHAIAVLWLLLAEFFNYCRAAVCAFGFSYCLLVRSAIETCARLAVLTCAWAHPLDLARQPRAVNEKH